jgi:hypothetical protein
MEAKMSGEKQVTIDSGRYRQLMRNSEQLRTIRSDLPETIMSSLRENSAQLQRRLEPLERRQAQYETALSHVRQEVRDIEVSTARRIAEQQRQFRQELDASIDGLRMETHNLLWEQERKMTNLIDQERQTREREIQNVQGQIDQIHADQHRKGELAITVVDEAQVVYDFINENYRHEQFTPGRLGKLRQSMQTARENINQGTPEAALSIAQIAFRDLTDLRLELEDLELQWQSWQNEALRSASQVLEEARNNRNFEVLDLEGKGTGIEQEADVWTNGKMGALQKEIENTIKTIESTKNYLSTEELQKIAEETTVQHQKKIAELLEEARLAVVSSQLRANIAELAVNALKDQGYILEDNTYVGEDTREGYIAKVKHRDGSEVVVSVDPDVNQPGKNNMNIHAFDEEIHTEHERFQRANELADSMRGHGLEVSNPREVAKEADPSMRDVKTLKKQKPKQQKSARVQAN